MVTKNFETLIATIEINNDLSNSIDTFLELINESDSILIHRWILALREKIFGLMLEKGAIPPSNLIQLFPLLHQQSFTLETDPRLDIHLITLKKHLTNVEKNSYEYFLIVDLIFILEMLNGQLETGFHNYLTSILKSNIFEAYKYPEGYEQFKTTLNHCEITADHMAEFLGRILELDSFFQNDDEARSSILLWIMTVIYAEPQYIASPSFFTLEKPLANIMIHFLELNMPAMAMQVYNVSHHILGNLFQTQKEMALFNEQFTKLISHYYMQLRASLPKPLSENKNKKKIAIIRDRFVNNSPHTVEYSLINMLMRDAEFTDKYDLYIYSVGYIEKELDDEKIIHAYKQLGVTVKVIPNEWYVKGYYYDHLEKANIIRNDMLFENIDIMIATVGNNNIIDFLFATRTAPYQIYWSHGNFAYEIDGIDAKITHCTIPKEKNLEYRSFLISQPKEFYNPVIDSNRIKNERALYPTDTLILGTIGRLVKMDSDDYLETIAEIMHKNVHTIYLACGSGDSDTLKQKVKMLGLEERFYFPGFVDPHLYGHIIDLYLDTFPLQSGESLAEYAGKGKPYVVMMNYDALSKNLQFEHDKFIKAHGDARPFAFSKKDYIDVTNHLLSNSEAFEEVTHYIVEEHVSKKPGSSAYFREEIENYGAKGFVCILEQLEREQKYYATTQMQKKQEAAERALFEDNGKKYCAEFEKIASGISDLIHQMLFELSSGPLEKRMYYNYFLAEHYFRSENAEQAKVFIERAWLFSHFNPHILPLYLQIHETIQDFESIREAYKRAGIEESKKNNIAKAIAYFNLWHYAEASYNKVDAYRYDFDIMDTIERMAEPYKYSYEREDKKEEGKRKIAFLIFGITHNNSSLIKSNKTYFKHLDMEQNSVEIFVLDRKKEVMNSQEARGHIAEFHIMGCKTHLFEDTYEKADRLIKISKAIHDFGADILLSGAAMAEFEHAFVIATKPAPKTVGFLLGPPEQFCYPFMDEIIGYSLHPMFDAPVNKSVYQQSRYENPGLNQTISRNEMGIAEDAIVLISMGRYTKFQNVEYWNAISELLIEHSNAYYLVAGVTYEQVSQYVNDEVKEKILFLGWVDNAAEYLYLADISLDTYPSGGGYTLADAMRVGIPAVVFENDFSQKYNQDNWSLAYELANIPELTVKRGDFDQWKGVVSTLINDKALRDDLGNQCKKYFAAHLAEDGYVSHIFEV